MTEMEPDRKTAERAIREAYKSNPGGWAEHSRYVAEACKNIASHCKGLSGEKAYVLGLLHDIGRYAGVSSEKHLIDGYRYCAARGWKKAAQICISHAFMIQDINTSIGTFDVSGEDYLFMKNFVENAVYDDYDRLVQLCDALAMPTGFCLLEKRFVEYLKRNTLKSKKALVFFIIFASFCFSAMTQMSFSMKDLSSEMMGVMMLVIGLVLAFTTLFLAITTVINGNTKTIAMMRVFGYSQKECCRAILGGYRPLSYIGFIIGTVYQYGLLRLMVDIVFKDVEGVPTYKFDFPTMLISLACFITIYEIMMYIYSEKIKKISIKEIMIE